MVLQPVRLLSELAAESQGHLAIVNALESRRCLERIVEPFVEVTIDEELLPQQRHQVGEAPAECTLELQVLDQQHGDEGSPYLCLNRVFRAAEEGLELQ